MSTVWFLTVFAIGFTSFQSGADRLPASQMKLLPPAVQKLARALEGSQPSERADICHRVLGKPNRDAGSGLTIWQWDFAEGVVSVTAQFPDSPIFHLKSGRLIYLIPRQTPIAKSMKAEHQVNSPHKGSEFYIGDLNLRPNGTYKFTDSGTNLEFRAGRSRNYFVKHPRGHYTVSYASGLGPTTLLESIAGKMVIARIAFKSTEGVGEIAFDVACDPKFRRMWLSVPPTMPFKIQWNY